VAWALESEVAVDCCKREEGDHHMAMIVVPLDNRQKLQTGEQRARHRVERSDSWESVRV
jgi:hypothetical protein